MTVNLPVIVHWVRDDGTIDIKVDLVGNYPAVTAATVDVPGGLETNEFQRRFRWATAVDVVTGIMPKLIAAGIDPFTYDLPITKYPAVAHPPLLRSGKLTDEFLRAISAEYLLRGRGYAQSLALEYQVTPRTVVSWIERSRERKILGRPTKRGAVGGSIEVP